jgi:hypothetical protein
LANSGFHTKPGAFLRALCCFFQQFSRPQIPAHIDSPGAANSKRYSIYARAPSSADSGKIVTITGADAQVEAPDIVLSTRVPTPNP